MLYNINIHKERGNEKTNRWLIEKIIGYVYENNILINVLKR